MNKDELKRRLIAECEESGLSCREAKKALDDASVYFFSREREILGNIPIKRLSGLNMENHGETGKDENNRKELRKQAYEAIVEVQKAKKQSRQSLRWSVAALIISIVVGIIQVVAKVQ